MEENVVPITPTPIAPIVTSEAVNLSYPINITKDTINGTNNSIAIGAPVMDVIIATKTIIVESITGPFPTLFDKTPNNLDIITIANIISNITAKTLIQVPSDLPNIISTTVVTNAKANVISIVLIEILLNFSKYFPSFKSSSSFLYAPILFNTP